MSYLAIADFKFGMDRRRKRIAGVPGTLWTLKNAVISRGGDIERAKKFVSTYALPANTFGMGKVRTQLYVFGSAAPPTMPRGVLYQQLANGVANMVRVIDVRGFAGKLYVVAEFDDGNICHYYNGTRVADWDTIGSNNSDFSTLAEYLANKINASTAVTATSAAGVVTIVAQVAGTSFTISGAVLNQGADNTQTITVATPTANVVAVAEVRATGTVTITGGTFSAGVNQVKNVTVNGVSLMSVAVDCLATTAQTASAVATEINNRTSTHHYTAAAVGSVITITDAPGNGATPNGYVVALSVGGNATGTTTNMTGGVTAVAAVAQISTVTMGGLYEAVDRWTVTINGTSYIATGRASGMGSAAFTNKQRMWSVAGTLLEGSKLKDPSNFSDIAASSGAVALDASNESEGSERLIGMGEYSSYLALMSRISIRLYTIDADATRISFYQALSNTGVLASRSIIAQGNNDTYYLAPTGIRSLRPRDVLNAAYVSDVGTAIDTFVRDHITSIPRDQVARAVAAIEPIDGRFWMALGNRIYVLSYFPSSKVTAWSYFEPGFSVSDISVIGDQVYVRAGDTIYLYGGASGMTYPNASEQTVQVDLPFLSADAAATQKLLKGFDIACTNEWAVTVLPDPNDETKSINIGRINRNSYPLSQFPVVGRSTHFALSLACTRAGAATISSMALHFDGEEAR